MSKIYSHKQIIKLLFFSIIYSFLNTISFSQTIPFVPRINIPTSPEAALLGRFGEIPIGYYTGTAEISIPIYTIKEGVIEIPIQLNYHNSGIKVSDNATWVGLGWDLSPGGAIIQEVRGKRDEFDVDNLNSSLGEFATFKNRLTNAGPIGSYKAFQQLGHGQYDPAGCPSFCVNGNCILPIGETFAAEDPPNAEPASLVGSLLLGNGNPDIFHYSFPGYSGEFYINPETHNIVQIDKDKDIKIEKTGFDAITITTLDGTKYQFDVVELASDLGASSTESSGKTFKLGSIQLLSGRTITFEYINAHTSNIEFTQSYLLYTTESETINQDLPTPHYTQSDVKILSKITTTEAVINFNTSTRDDINLYANDNLKKLSSIDISSSQSTQKIKTFEFGYSYFPYNLIANPTIPSTQVDILGKRLKLNYVKEIGYDNNGTAVNTKPAFQFDYDLSQTMPLKCSFAKDMYGYYNGKPNTTLLPDLDYFQYNDNSVVPFTYGYTKANRYTDNMYAGAYMLNKITYPTGGITQFEYEPNSFTNQFIPDKVAAENVISYNNAYDNSVAVNSDIQFTLDRKTKINFQNSIRNGLGNYNNVTPLTEAQMQDCYIELYKIKFANGIVQKTSIRKWDLSPVPNLDFQNNGGASWNESVVVEYDPDPQTVYHVKAYYPDNLNNNLFASIAGVTSVFVYNNYSLINQSESHQCGMRIKTIKNYTHTGELLTTKGYTYNGGKLLNRFNPIKLRYIWSFHCMGGGIGYCQCPQRTENDNAPEISISSDLIHEGGNLIGYDFVEETELASNAIDNNGKKVFNFYNQENLSDNNYPVVKNLMNGKKYYESIYNKSGDQIAKTTFNYVDLNSGIQCYYGISIIQNFLGNYDPRESAVLGARSKFTYLATPIISQWNKLQSVTTTQFSGSSSLIATESYTYNTEGSIKTLSTVNSKLETLTTKYFYPTDNLIHPYVDNYMITVHNIGTPVITERYNGTTLLSRQRTMYGSVPDGPTLLPQYIYDQIGTNTEEKRMTINSYDNFGNITQFTQENNIPVSFVWNAEKNHPIAKIENATYASLLALPNGLYSDFRTHLPNARVTTYTYKPLVGVSTISDPNGKTIYYEYDAFSRLYLIRDQNNNILKKFCYNYAGQQESCTTGSSGQSTSALWQSTGNLRCMVDGYGNNTGYQESEERDNNSYSSTYNQLRWVNNGYNPSACPLPSSCTSCYGEGQQCINGQCELGFQVYMGSVYQSGYWYCLYHYEFSDGSWSQDYIDYNSQSSGQQYCFQSN